MNPIPTPINGIKTGSISLSVAKTKPLNRGRCNENPHYCISEEKIEIHREKERVESRDLIQLEET